MQMLISTVGLFMAFDDYEHSLNYYTPLWRTQHFMLSFYRSFFALPPGVKYEDKNSPENSIDNFIHYLSVEESITRSQKYLQWGQGFSYERLEQDSKTLLDKDSIRLSQLKKNLEKHIPYKNNI